MLKADLEKKLHFTQKAFDELLYNYCKLKDEYLQLNPNPNFEFYQFGKEKTKKISYWREKYFTLSKEVAPFFRNSKEIEKVDRKTIKKILKRIKQDLC